MNKATLHTFDPKTGEWTQRSVFVKIEKEHFARGGLRYFIYFFKKKNSIPKESLSHAICEGIR